MFCEESLGNINAKDVELVLLESVDYFRTSEYFGGREKIFDGEANWWVL